MKITIITSPFGDIPPFGYGAVERLWYNLSLEFVKNNHEVSIIAKNPPKKAFKQEDSIAIQYIKGYSWSVSFAKNLCLDFIYSFKALSKMSKTEILVMNTFWSPILCVLFKKKFKVSVYNVARYPKGQFKFYKHINRLSCVTKPVYDGLIKQVPSVKDKVKIISNPISTNVFKYYAKKQNTLKIIYTGRVCKEKGLTILVAAVNKLIEKYPKIELILMGPRTIEDGGDGDVYINKLTNLATNFSITWVNPTSSPQELCDAIVKSDIYCYPSIAEKGETFGVAPLEAMATGTATIVSNLACFKDFVKENKNALVFDHNASNNVELLKDKLEILIKNPEKRKELGLESYKTSLNYSNEKIAKQYIEDFKYLLS